MPQEKSMKFVPKAPRCTQLGEIYLKYHGVRELLEKVRCSPGDVRNGLELITTMQDDGQSPWLKFAKGVIAGEYKS